MHQVQFPAQTNRKYSHYYEHGSQPELKPAVSRPFAHAAILIAATISAVWQAADASFGVLRNVSFHPFAVRKSPLLTNFRQGSILRAGFE